ncbi:hypothetical protein [Paenibacillus borealis]|uniref:hypothetical protein n=1 Tax=Paenibacillus borealis TaxID=160799 RepID=UPI0014318BD9|nr:hypothetical protein [Paenibacillus borealis]
MIYNNEMTEAVILEPRGFGFSASYMETPNTIPNPPPLAILLKTMENAIPKLMPIKSAESNLHLYFKTQHPSQLFYIYTHPGYRHRTVLQELEPEFTAMQQIGIQADEKTPAASFWAAARKLLGAQVEMA